jgi:hypothetical protein
MVLDLAHRRERALATAGRRAELQEANAKDDGRIGRNEIEVARAPEGKFRRNHEPSLAAPAHAHETLVPPLYHLAPP